MILAVTLLGLLAFSAEPARAGADELTAAYDGKACSLSVSLLSGDLSDSADAAPVTGGELAIYRVAAANGESLEFEGEFAGCNVGLNEAVTPEGAVKLGEWVEHETIEPQASKAVGQDGKVVFPDLSQGVYLVVQTVDSPGFCTLAPFAVSLPMTDGAGEGLVYDVQASPKVEPKPSVPVKTTTLSLVKVWCDLPAGETRADGTVASGARITHAPVTVDLLKDGSLYDSVVLDASSNWAHTWTGLAADAQWSVVEERVPAGYSASYTLSGDVENGLTATVTNTELAQKLIQTGQLKWPVPVLAAAGVAVFALGWRMVRSHGAAAGQKVSSKDSGRG